MIKTAISINSTPIKTGNVITQPVLPVNKDATSGVVQNSSTKLPFTPKKSSDATGVNMGVDLSGGTVTTDKSTALTKAVSTLIENPQYLIQPKGSNSVIVQVSDITNFAYTPKSNDNANVVTKSISPYEKLTNIAEDRPALVSLTKFCPISLNDSPYDNYDDYDSYKKFLTEIGAYFDTQVQFRNLKKQNIRQLIEYCKTYRSVENIVKNRNIELYRSVQTANKIINQLYEFTRQIDKCKLRLDPRDDYYRSQLASDMKLFLKTFAPEYISDSAPNTKFGAKTFIEDSAFETPAASQATSLDAFTTVEYDIPGIFAERGYNADYVKNLYSSTKTYLQLLIEVKNDARYHSPSLINQVNKKLAIDTSTFGILKYSASDFFNAKSTTIVNVGDLVAFNKISTKSYVDNISKKFEEFCNFDKTKNAEYRISNILNVISREYRYSSAIATKQVKQNLLVNFGFNAADTGNENLFDFVFGQYGSNAYDIQLNQIGGISTLTKLAQKTENDISILTFENSYIQNDNGIFTPGSSYYVDSILNIANANFDISKLSTLANQLKTTYASLGTFVKDFNLNFAKIIDKLDEKFVMNDPRSLFEFISAKFFDFNGELRKECKSDPLFFIFTAAILDKKLKAALFLYMSVACNAQLSPDAKKPADDAVIELIQYIIDRLKDIAKNASTSVGKFFSSIYTTSESDTSVILMEMYESLYSTKNDYSTIVDKIKNIIVGMISEFKNSDALFSNKSRYSAYNDTTLMMLIFDAVITVIANFSGISINSYDDAKQKISYNTITAYKAQASIDTIKSIITSDITSRQKASSSLMNFVQKLLSCVEAVKTSSSDVSKNVLPELISNTNVDELKHYINKQQLQIARNSLRHMFNEYEDEDEGVELFETSNLSQKYMNIFNRVMSLPEYSSKKGYNKLIATIGMPHNITSRLKKISTTTIDKKESDVIKIVVRRVDVTHPEIVYKPQEFIFELSRFVSKDQKYFVDNEIKTKEDVLLCIPTIDYSSPSSNEEPLYKNALDSSNYSFLSDKQKSNMLFNHIMNDVISTYMSVLTGINPSESEFLISERTYRYVDSNFMRTLIESVYSVYYESLSRVGSSKANGIFFANGPSSSDISTVPSKATNVNFALQNIDSPQKLETSLSFFNEKVIEDAIHMLSVISDFSNSRTSLMSADLFKRWLYTPKLYERVFSVMFDPDDFEIDYAKTTSTPFGKSMLEQLVNRGDIVLATDQTTNTGQNNLKTFAYRPKDVSEGDLTFDKYFFTIETMNETYK